MTDWRSEAGYSIACRQREQRAASTDDRGVAHSAWISGEGVPKAGVTSPRGHADTSAMAIFSAAGIPTVYIFYFPVCSD